MESIANSVPGAYRSRDEAVHDQVPAIAKGDSRVKGSAVLRPIVLSSHLFLRQSANDRRCRATGVATPAALSVSAEDLDGALGCLAPLDTRTRSDQRNGQGLSQGHVLSVVCGKIGMDGLDARP